MKCVDAHLYFNPAKENPAEDIVPCTRGNFEKTAVGAGGWVLEQSVSLDLCWMLPGAGIACDVGTRHFSREAICYLQNSGCRINQHDNRAGISTRVTRLLETDYLINGRSHAGGAEAAAGGILPR